MKTRQRAVLERSLIVIAGTGFCPAIAFTMFRPVPASDLAAWSDTGRGTR